MNEGFMNTEEVIQVLNRIDFYNNSINVCFSKIIGSVTSLEHDYFDLDERGNIVGYNNSFEFKKVFKTISNNNEFYLNFIKNKLYSYVNTHEKVVREFGGIK